MILPQNFYLPVVAALGVNLQIMALGYQVAKSRSHYFNKDFMIKQWGNIHRSQIGQEIQLGGFPDSGSGIYSGRLSYRDWYQFNILQRIHLNAFESVSLAQTSILAAGIYRPNEAALLGLVYLVGRFLYARGAKANKGGYQLRRVGLVLSTLMLVANSGIFIYHLVKTLKK